MTLKKEDIYKTIKSLSKSQGFYCRMLQLIDENKSILNKLEKQNFKDSVDLVLFLENGDLF